MGVQNRGGQRLTEFCQEIALVIVKTLLQQHNRRLYTWTSPDGQHWKQIDYILCNKRWRSSRQSVKTSLGADCGSDHEFFFSKFRLKLKKVGETTRPFRYESNPKSNPLWLFSGSDKQIQGIISSRQGACRTRDRVSWHCTGGNDQDRPQEK